jgi:hypothetical protein
MPGTTVLFGILLIAYGIFTFTEAIHKSPTAAIPAYFGVVLLALGLMAQRAKLRKHAMHTAVVIGLIGVVGGLVMGGSKIPALLQGEKLTDAKPGEEEKEQTARNKAVSQNCMALICAVYVGFGVASFVRIRLARKAAASSAQVPK